MQRLVFAPLGMASAGFGAPDALGGDAPCGHIRQADGECTPHPRADNPPAHGPAGTVHVSLRDWARFLALMLAAARGEATGLLSEATAAQLVTPGFGGDYACGWSAVHRGWAGDLPALNHTGSNTFWHVDVWLAPARNVALIAGANCDSDDAADVVDGVIAAMLPLFCSDA